MDHGGARPIWAFLTGPYALFLFVLLLVPFANIAMYSLHPYSPTKVFLPELTFDNYRKIFDLYYVRLFGRTLRLGLITTAVCAVLGYPLAYCLARARPRWQAVGLFLLIMPLMVSAVIRVFGWIVILGRKGLLNQALLALGAGAGQAALQRDSSGHRARQHFCAVHGAADHGVDRAHFDEP
jgi:ABC-type spermidine/putrescine transport system permease subunit I